MTSKHLPGAEDADEAEGPEQPHVLTRERLMTNSLDEMVRGAFGAQLMSETDRARSLHETLEQRPPGSGPVWLFGYGSLIWNPTIHYADSRFARVEGWQRAFCLSTPVGRGTPENPGLVLALDEGGYCEGVAFRIEEAVLVQELSLIWRREMLTGAYIPRWLPLHDAEGKVFGQGIGFVVNRAGPQYADLTEADVVRRLATAVGHLGSAADYLRQTHRGLRRLGIRDALLDRLLPLVAQAQERTG
ncbi:gamma-glutamylcyclotransferase [Teichococcus wenyumeiae]|uniref:gamma-glutamylcyclotransferase n=1 Tax=Teichococcus wenyumeiae TaxID=2478470 RepID=UPI001F3E97B5|nr:gamma-glutamylcyclotransferase [Pseudoroseomonas wenyumeiae]